MRTHHPPPSNPAQVQRLSLSVDHGYVEGGYFRLAFPTASATSTTPCLEWGLSAQALEDALQVRPSVRANGQG